MTLDAARDKATDMRGAAREGRDLAQERKLEAARATTFRQAFESFLETKGKALTGSRHKVQWTSQMRDHVFPKIGSKPVGDATTADVIEVLKPLWHDKAETGKASTSGCMRSSNRRSRTAGG